MLLVWSDRDDPTGEAVAGVLGERGCGWWGLDAGGFWPRSPGAPEMRDTRWLSRVEAVLVRPGRPASSGRFSLTARHAVMSAMLWRWLDEAPSRIRVLNRPRAAASNESKPSQLHALAAAGFSVPETLVTTDPHAAAQFCREVGTAVVKSVSGERSIVRRLRHPSVEDLHAVAHCPTLFQRHIAGVDVRAHVVGDRVFAHAIESAAADYRYAHRESEARTISCTTLPSEVAARCVALARSLHLSLTGVDLRAGDDGRWYAFEANPSPAFAFFERYANTGIAEAVGDLLVGGHRPMEVRAA